MGALASVSRMLPRRATTEMKNSTSRELVRIARYPSMCPHRRATHLTDRSNSTIPSITQSTTILEQGTILSVYHTLLADPLIDKLFTEE